MRNLIVVIGFILFFCGVAYSFAPVIPIPVPPPAIGPEIAKDPAGSRKNTHVFQDISEDVGTICDTASVCASRAWWAYKASNTVPATILGSMGSELKNKLETTYYGVIDWITYDLPTFLDKYDDKPPGTYPDLEPKLSGLYTPGINAEPPLEGQSFKLSPGGNLWWVESNTNYLITGLSAAAAMYPTKANAELPKDSWITSGPYPQSYSGTMNYRQYDNYRQMYVRKFGIAYYVPHETSALHARVYEYLYVTPEITVPEDPANPWPIPTGTPAAWNLPGVRDAMNNPANQVSPGVKEDIGNVIKDNPGLIDPSTTKLTDEQITQIANAIVAEIAKTNADLAQQIADANPTDTQSQIDANDALQDAIEEEQDANANITTPDIVIAPRKTLDFEPLSPLISQSRDDDSVFPFDFLGHIQNVWSSLVATPEPPIIGIPMPFNAVPIEFSFEPYTEIVKKFRDIISWVMLIITAWTIVRRYGEDS